MEQFKTDGFNKCNADFLQKNLDKSLNKFDGMLWKNCSEVL